MSHQFNPVHMSARDQSFIPLHGVGMGPPTRLYGGSSRYGRNFAGNAFSTRRLSMAPPRRLYGRPDYTNRQPMVIRGFAGLGAFGAGEVATAATTSEAYNVEIGDAQMLPTKRIGGNPSMLCSLGWFSLGVVSGAVLVYSAKKR